MSIKNLIFLLAGAVLLFGYLVIATPNQAAFAAPSASNSEQEQKELSGKDPALEECQKDRGKKCDFIGQYVNPAINLVTFAFGLIAIISLILGGIQYSASAGDPQAVSKAKKRIVDTLIAVVAYFFLYVFLQFLVPGGF